MAVDTAWATDQWDSTYTFDSTLSSFLTNINSLQLPYNKVSPNVYGKLTVVILLCQFSNTDAFYQLLSL